MLIKLHSLCWNMDKCNFDRRTQKPHHQRSHPVRIKPSYAEGFANVDAAYSYKGKCYAWDVVNEALNDDGTYRADVFYNTIGPAYIPIAFAAAAAADPNVKLYYNDYNIENAGAKSTAAQAIVKSIKTYGAKIDGVGLQSHFIVGSTPSQSVQASNMAAFVALGVEVAVTELDVRMTLPSTAALLAQQSTDYANTVAACVATAGCIGITIWDYTDKVNPSPRVVCCNVLTATVLLGAQYFLWPRRSASLG